MTTKIIPGRLAELDTLTLDSGSHEDFLDGHCAMEVVAWAAAGAADWDALAPTVTALQDSALDLLDRMIAGEPGDPS